MKAEELIVHVFAEKRRLLDAGKRPTGVVISRSDYSEIQDYHRSLGFLPDGVEDYISRYELFDLPFMLHDGTECRVATDDEPREGDGGT